VIKTSKRGSSPHGGYMCLGSAGAQQAGQDTQADRTKHDAYPVGRAIDAHHRARWPASREQHDQHHAGEVPAAETAASSPSHHSRDSPPRPKLLGTGMRPAAVAPLGHRADMPGPGAATHDGLRVSSQLPGAPNRTEIRP
jgi:hypothetical protein